MNQREVTLADIFECLKEQKREIKEAKNETNKKIEKFMMVIENNIQEVRIDVTVLNGIMEERECENQIRLKRLEERFTENEMKTKERMIENEKKTNEKYEVMKNRLIKFEEAMRRTNFSK